MVSNPLVSVVIPTYNRAHLLWETLESLISQTYKNWECIIVDDGSTDNTEEVVKKYSATDDRIKFYNRPSKRRKGASPCRNYGLEISRGDFIQFLDSDDLLNNTKFEEQLKLLENYDRFALVTCKWGSFKTSKNLKVKTKYHSYRNFKESTSLLRTFGKYNEYFPPLVYLVSKELINKSGHWNETIPNNPNDDGEYFTRIVINASRVIFCAKTEGYYRAGNDNRLSLLDEKDKILGSMKSWELINSHLLKTNKLTANIYVNNGKRNIFKQIKDIYPDIIKENKEYFSGLNKRRSWFSF